MCWLAAVSQLYRFKIPSLTSWPILLSYTGDLDIHSTQQASLCLKIFYTYNFCLEYSVPGPFQVSPLHLKIFVKCHSVLLVHPVYIDHVFNPFYLQPQYHLFCFLEIPYLCSVWNVYILHICAVWFLYIFYIFALSVLPRKRPRFVSVVSCIHKLTLLEAKD